MVTGDLRKFTKFAKFLLAKKQARVGKYTR